MLQLLTDHQLDLLLAKRRKRIREEQERQRQEQKNRPVPDTAANRVRARLAAEGTE